MNIAMLTTWDSACGIAEYSRNLIEELSLLGHNILLFTNKALNAHPRIVIVPIFGVHWWGENPAIDVAAFLSAWDNFEDKYGKIDIFHVQYQGSLYAPEGFNLLEKTVSCKKVITFHDSSKHPRHNFDSFITISHNPNINADNYIPFPTIERVPVVASFGMGDRNDYEFIEKACNEIGVQVWKHDARKAGWLEEEELFEEMIEADAIVLWYNDVPIEGQSAALRTAISSMRPVIVNDVGWFKDAPSFVKKATTKDSLQFALADILHLDYIRRNSYKECAKKHLEIYK